MWRVLSKKWVLAIALLALGLAIFLLPDLFRTAELVVNLSDAARQSVDIAGVIETDITVGIGPAEKSARVYQMDTRGPKTAILLAPGVRD